MRAAAALLALLLAAAPALASERRPTLAELEPQLVCPTCETTLDMSDSPVAQRMRAYIRARIAAGDTESEIKAKLVADFGEGVLAAPPRRGFDLLAWLLPAGGLLAGAGAVGALAWRWSRARGDAVSAGGGGQPLDPELERRVDDALARFDP